MRLSKDDLALLLAKKGYADASQNHRPMAPAVPHAVAQHDARQDTLGAAGPKAKGSSRIVVRIERRGARLLDKDNLYGSAKYLCDALRYEKLIPADDPEAIDLQVTQRVVGKAERGTLVTIEQLQP